LVLAKDKVTQCVKHAQYSSFRKRNTAKYFTRRYRLSTITKLTHSDQRWLSICLQ